MQSTHQRSLPVTFTSTTLGVVALTIVALIGIALFNAPLAQVSRINATDLIVSDHA